MTIISTADTGEKFVEVYRIWLTEIIPYPDYRAGRIIFEILVEKVKVQEIIAKSSIIKGVTFEVDNCAEENFFLYNIQECSVRFGDKEIKALIASRIRPEAKIINSGRLLTALKDRKKVIQRAYRFQIADLKENTVEIYVGQYKRKLVRIDAYYKCFQTKLNHKQLRYSTIAVKTREASASENKSASKQKRSRVKSASEKKEKKRIEVKTSIKKTLAEQIRSRSTVRV